MICEGNRNALRAHEGTAAPLEACVEDKARSSAVERSPKPAPDAHPGYHGSREVESPGVRLGGWSRDTLT